jgi:hypothetical protein
MIPTVLCLVTVDAYGFGGGRGGGSLGPGTPVSRNARQRVAYGLGGGRGGGSLGPETSFSHGSVRCGP